MLNPPVNGKIQGFFKAFECFSSTFQGKFNFQGLFKTALCIQVLFKPVRTMGIQGTPDMSHNSHKKNCMISPASYAIEIYTIQRKATLIFFQT